MESPFELRLRNQLLEAADHLEFTATVDALRHRAQRRRLLDTTAVAVAAVLAVAVVAVPTLLLTGGAGPAGERAGGAGGPPCRTLWPSEPAHGFAVPRGPLLATGSYLDGYEVVLAVAGPLDDPAFTLAFRDPARGQVYPWDTAVLGRGPAGDFAGKMPGDPEYQFFDSQIVLTPDRVLHAGVYSRRAERITMTYAGSTTGLRTAASAEVGWTLFWSEQDSRSDVPRSSDLTLTAYGVGDKVQHTVTGGPHVGDTQRPADPDSLRGGGVRTTPWCPPSGTPTPAPVPSASGTPSVSPRPSSPRGSSPTPSLRPSSPGPKPSPSPG